MSNTTTRGRGAAGGSDTELLRLEWGGVVCRFAVPPLEDDSLIHLAMRLTRLRLKPPPPR
jgi:hypothetical protein